MVDAEVRGRTRPGFAGSRVLRPSAKVLPEHARGHNRALVLQTLYRSGRQSRADIARGTGLTRVTVSHLVAELITDGFVIEIGLREGSRPGKPATLIDIDRAANQIIGLDLSEHSTFRGAVLDLDGTVLSRAEVPLEGNRGDGATERVMRLAHVLVEAATAPVLGMGVGSPGVVDTAGVVLTAPNLGWEGVALRPLLEARFAVPVVVSNDANAAVMAEHSFGDADGDVMLVRIGHGVGAGLLLGGAPLFGSRFAAGEIGHVVVGTDGGDLCACGKAGCLETWLAAPRLQALLARAGTQGERDAVLRQAGARLGIALAPIVGALNLPQIVLSGPVDLLDGALLAATVDTLRDRTMAQFHRDLVVRLTGIGEDIVIRGAAVLVLSDRLGVS